MNVTISFMQQTRLRLNIGTKADSLELMEETNSNLCKISTHSKSKGQPGWSFNLAGREPRKMIPNYSAFLIIVLSEITVGYARSKAWIYKLLRLLFTLLVIEFLHFSCGFLLLNEHFLHSFNDLCSHQRIDNFLAFSQMFFGVVFLSLSSCSVALFSKDTSFRICVHSNS